MNADHARPSRNPPITSVGQCAPAQIRPMHANTTTNPATIQVTTRQRGPTWGEIATASIKASQVKKIACPLG